MKVLFALPRFHTNQIPIINLFISRGHQVVVHVASYGNSESHIVSTIKAKSSRIMRLIHSNGPNNPGYLPSIAEYISELKRVKPDLVIARSHCIAWCLLLAFLKTFIGYELIITTQVSNQEFNHYLKQSLWLGLIKKHVALWLAQIFDVRLVTVIPDSYSTTFKERKYFHYLPLLGPERLIPAKPCKKYDIISVGKMRQRKRHEDLVKAILILRENYSYCVNCIIVAECVTTEEKSYFQDLKALIASYKLTGNITFALNLPYDEVINLYLSCRLFVLPAINEPASVSVIEALSFGLPVICTDSCGTSTYIQDGTSGRVVPGKNPKLIASAAHYLLVSLSLGRFRSDSVINSLRSKSSPELYLNNIRNMLLNIKL